MVLCDSCTYTLLTLLTSLTTFFLLYIKWKQSYWKRRGLEYEKGEFFFGSSRNLLLQKESIADFQLNIYKKYKPLGLKCIGTYAFTSPTCTILDPELAKNIMIKDFPYFHNRGLFVNEKNDPLSGSLLNLEDDKWRNLRTKLTPTFTSGKMKMMFETFVDCTKGLETMMSKYAETGEAVDIKDALGRFTTDIIASCAFGLECNSMVNPDSEFRKYGKRVFEPKNFLEKYNFVLSKFIPKYIANLIGFKTTKSDVEHFMKQMVKGTVDYREKHNIYRKDFMHLLIQLKNLGEVNDGEKIISSDGKKQEIGLTMDELTAQAYVFFVAGFETSSTTMAFTLYELGANQDIQEKLRNEIKSVLKKYDNKITYEAINEMTYLQKVVEESMRKYPPAPSLPRQCTLPYKIPNTSVVLEPGTRLFIPVIGIHRDSEYYPNPELFDPERFNEENKAKRPPCTYLPFGDGPRNCIGLRFGLLQSKVGLAAFLKDFKVTVNSKTKEPFEFDSKTFFILSVKGDIWLNVSKINE